MNSIHYLCLVPDKNKDLPSSERNLIAAISWLEYLHSAVGIDDEIVDFTREGGWDKFDKALSLLMPLEPSNLFGEWDEAGYWVQSLGLATNKLKVSTFPLLPGQN